MNKEEAIKEMEFLKIAALIDAKPCNINTEAIDYAIKALQNERPKGKYLITDAYPHKVYCSECFKTFAHTNWEIWKDGSLPRNFCPNCGAELR